MLVARRDPVSSGRARYVPIPNIGHHAPRAPGLVRTMSALQMIGTLLAIPVGIGSGYSIYRANFSAETTCQRLRGNIVSMLDKSVDAHTRHMLVRRDVESLRASLRRRRSRRDRRVQGAAGIRPRAGCSPAPLTAKPVEAEPVAAKPVEERAAKTSCGGRARKKPVVAKLKPAERDASRLRRRMARGRARRHDIERDRAVRARSASGSGQRCPCRCRRAACARGAPHDRIACILPPAAPAVSAPPVAARRVCRRRQQSPRCLRRRPMPVIRCRPRPCRLRPKRSIAEPQTRSGGWVGHIPVCRTDARRSERGGFSRLPVRDCRCSPLRPASARSCPDAARACASA